MAIISSSIGLYLFVRDPDSEAEIHRLTSSTYNSRRPGGARLSGASYASAAAPNTADLGKAQVLLLRSADSKAHQRLQGRIYLAAGEWRKFIEVADDPASQITDGATVNNLGVALLALSDADPGLLLKALDTFERARQLDPERPRVLSLISLLPIESFVSQSSRPRCRTGTRPLMPDPRWQKELANPAQIDEASILDQLERAVQSGKFVEAERLFQAYPELCRRVAMQHALYGEPESPDVLHFIAAQMEQHYGDKTVTAMLAPLFTEQRDVAMAVRHMVNRGAQLNVDGKYDESRSAYDEATRLARNLDSSFDRLWIDLNEMDTGIRFGKFNDVRRKLSQTIAISEELGFAWLKAKALSIGGSTVRLTPRYTDLLKFLTSANAEFVRLDAPHDRIRVLYYLAAYRHYGGDQDEALRLALECLRIADADDVRRISTLDWLIGSILYRSEKAERALLFAKEAVEQSQNGPYAGGLAVQSSISLAELYQSMSQYKLADESLKVAEDAFEKVPPGFDRIRNELLVGAIKAKALMSQKRYGEAESLLQRNLDLYSQQPFSATALLAQSRMLLGQVYSETGRVNEAAQMFNDAIDVVEKDDEYMKLETIRVKFDDNRRALYDAALEFEFKRGSLDAAWDYLQRYRAKLFLEVFAAFNPKMQTTRSRLDRAGIQLRIPKYTQVVEYSLLKDRLLIWLVTDKVFILRSAPVSRSELESKTEKALERMRNGEDADSLLTELGKWLIEPISDVLDPDRAITFIPDRVLHGLPFAALKQPGKNRYLIEDFPIVVSPSLTHFLTGGGALPRRDAIVGFGSQNGGPAEFKELSSLKNVYPSAKIFTGQQVDRSSFLAALEKSALFHYAGHSATDSGDPLRSSILLDGDRFGPNSVAAIDISQQRLSSGAVVILSSCDSSVGNSRDGVGMRGLTSAFLIGGAGSVVGSLWPVEASSTSELMIRFHQAFANSRLPVAQALREAQLAFLKAFPNRTNPYYWSGFVVTGNFNALR